MSLRAWYPFNGNTNNQGTGNLNLIQTVAPTYASNGKLCSKALATGAFKWSAAQAASIFNNQAISIAFWIKPLVSEKASICLFG